MRHLGITAGKKYPEEITFNLPQKGQVIATLDSQWLHATLTAFNLPQKGQVIATAAS